MADVNNPIVIVSAGVLMGGACLGTYTYTRAVLSAQRQLGHVVGAMIYVLMVEVGAIWSIGWLLVVANVIGAMAMLGVYGRYRRTARHQSRRD